MNRLFAATLALITVGTTAGFGLATPAAAQDAGGDRVNQLIVYGDDACPESTAEEITVCARKSESERYRIPEPLRGADNPANTAWTQRVMAYEMVGKTGTNSCSPVGAGGDLGCTQKLISAAYEERKNSADVKFGQLIAKAREERLSTIDADANEDQKRVEEVEKDYFERQAAQQAAGEGGADPTGDPLPDPNKAP